jgi:hypothetical protein
MPIKFIKRNPVQTIMGQRIPEPRPTLMAALWAFVYLGLPILVVGTLLDMLVQYATGVCTGWWCWFN